MSYADADRAKAHEVAELVRWAIQVKPCEVLGMPLGDFVMLCLVAGVVLLVIWERTKP